MAAREQAANAKAQVQTLSSIDKQMGAQTKQLDALNEGIEEANAELKVQTGLQRAQLGISAAQLGISREHLDVSRAQLGVSTAQLDELGAIKSHLGAQLASARRQATLAQVLFDVEVAAQRLSELAHNDPFGAGVLASQVAAAFDAVTVHDFDTVENKRAWAHAIGMLAQLWRWIAGQPDAAALAQRLLAALELGRRWTLDPHAALAAADQRLAYQRSALDQTNHELRELERRRESVWLRLVDIVLDQFQSPRTSERIQLLQTQAFTQAEAVSRLDRERTQWRTEADYYERWRDGEDGIRLIEAMVAQHPALAS